MYLDIDIDVPVMHIRPEATHAMRVLIRRGAHVTDAGRGDS
jgi:hypothetical protein